MDSQSDGSIEFGRPLYMDGISLELLMGRVYHEIGGWLTRQGRNLNCEVISWEPVEVALDIDVMLNILNTAISWIIATNPAKIVNLRAWPSPDGVTVSFELSIDGGTRVDIQSPAHPGALLPIRDAIEQMGGCIHSDSFASSFTRVEFKLIRWVGDDLLNSSRRLAYCR